MSERLTRNDRYQAFENSIQTATNLKIENKRFLLDLLKNINEGNFEALKANLQETDDLSFLNLLSSLERSYGFYIMELAFFSEFHEAAKLLSQQNIILTEIELGFLLSAGMKQNNVEIWNMVYDYNCQKYADDEEKIYFWSIGSWLDYILFLGVDLKWTYSEMEFGLNWVFDNIPQKYLFGKTRSFVHDITPALFEQLCAHPKFNVNTCVFSDNNFTLLHSFCHPYVKVENRIERIEILLNCGADIDIMNESAMTPTEMLFWTLNDIEKRELLQSMPTAENILTEEIISIFEFLCKRGDISLLTLTNCFYQNFLTQKKNWSQEELESVTTLILDYCLQTYQVDLRKEFLKRNLNNELKLYIGSLKTTEEKQNELLMEFEQSNQQKTKQKKKKRKKKKKPIAVEKISQEMIAEKNVKTFTTENISKPKKEKNLKKIQKISEESKVDVEKNLEKLESRILNEKNSEIEKLKLENESFKMEIQQLKNFNEEQEKKNLEQKNENKKLKTEIKKLKKNLKQIHPCLQARYLVENIFEKIFPKFHIDGDLYSSIKNLKEADAKNRELCHSLEYCRRAGNTISHLRARLKYEEDERSGKSNINETMIQNAFWSISRELPDFELQFQSPLWVACNA